MCRVFNKKIFLDELPTKTYKGTKSIDWDKCIGYKIKFIYDDIEDFIIIDKIIHIKNKENKILIKYKNEELLITPSHLKECKIGKLLKKVTGDFKIYIGETFIDNKRNIRIIDKEYRNENRRNGRVEKIKYYKYYCNKCNGESWIRESELLGGTGCSICCNAPKTVIKGINDIATTNPELVKYFVNIEDTYEYNIGSDTRLIFKCPNCCYKKIMRIADIKRRGFSCPRCGDGISYPEKFMFNLLQQLNIYFIKEYSKTNSKWCSNYKYDFYFKLNNEEYIIETHGMQHYEDSFKSCGGRTLEEEQENDKNKKELAIKNGIKPDNYIVIDCRYSEFEFIKNNIINSRLNDIFDLNNVDWIDIEKYSRKSLIKQVCDYWHIHNEINNENLTTGDLGKIFKLNYSTIRRYLKKGNNLEWCSYHS